MMCYRNVLQSILCATLAAHAGAATNEMTAASFETLLVHVQTVGSTAAKRERKRLAREELFRREARSLRYLMDNVHIENGWITILAENLVRRLPAEAAVPVLLDSLVAPRSRTRKFGAYWLGFYDTPQHAPAVVPLLDHEETLGAAIRTLGTWRHVAAATRIRACATHAEERIRVRAVNALRDLRDEASVPALIAATRDPVFTVRKAASRALGELGKQAEHAVRDALESAKDPSRRELLAALGHIGRRRGIRVLRRRLDDPDPLIRDSAARALLQAAPDKAVDWLHDAGLNPDLLRVAEDYK